VYVMDIEEGKKNGRQVFLRRVLKKTGILERV
jgi:hypothetical protein